MQKKAAVRLVLWYSCAFLLNALLLFVLGFFLLSSYLAKEDHAALQLKLMELVHSFEQGGLPSLQEQISMEKTFGNKNPYFIRLFDQRNRTMVQAIPPSLAGGGLPDPADVATEAGGIFSWPMRNGKGVLEITSSSFSGRYLLLVGKNRTERDKVLAHFRKALGILMIPAPLFCLMGGWLLAYRSLLPIRHLTDTVRAVYSGQTGHRVPMSKGGEGLDDLVMLFNAMLERIENLIRGLRESLDNVAHDLRTPMTRLRGIAELALRSQRDDESLREALVECMEESDRILTMLDTLMDISEAETGTIRLELRDVDMAHVLKEAAELYGYSAEEKGVRLEAHCEEGLHVSADPNRIRQVLGNLLDNAVKYTPAGGRVMVDASVMNGEVVISVRDSGIGIPEQDLPKIFERLYRCDHSRSEKGLGLGLSLVKAVVQAHRGRVEASSTLGQGSTFTLFLPLSA